MSVRGVRHLVSDKCILTSADCIGQVMTTISGGAASRILFAACFPYRLGTPIQSLEANLVSRFEKGSAYREYMVTKLHVKR